MTERARIVHEGRGGYVAVGAHQYPIEHIEGGHFVIHFPAGNRSRSRGAHLAVLMDLCASEPDKWRLETSPARRR